jgi:hypothetical protein
MEKFNYNRMRQLKLGNEWDLSFEDWYQFWLSHGVDKNSPQTGYMTKDTLCLVRKNNTLSYNIDNIMAATHGDAKISFYARRSPTTRPHVWIIKDPELHQLYDPFLKARSQANFRGETWALNFEEFAGLWKGLWQFRGRASTDFCMTRQDPEGAWDPKNAVVISRRESLQLSRAYREAQGIKLRGRGPAKK